MIKFLVKFFKLKNKYKIELEYNVFERPRYYIKVKHPLCLFWRYLDYISHNSLREAKISLNYKIGNAQTCFLYKDDMF